MVPRMPGHHPRTKRVDGARCIDANIASETRSTPVVCGASHRRDGARLYVGCGMVASIRNPGLPLFPFYAGAEKFKWAWTPLKRGRPGSRHHVKVETLPTHNHQT